MLREGVRVLAQALMDAEVSSKIGAEPYERSDERTAHRNGYRSRTWNTRVGTIELRIPKSGAADAESFGDSFCSYVQPSAE